MTTDTFTRTAAYISGGICGETWMPRAFAGSSMRKDARGPFGFFDRFSEPATFRDALQLVLSENGGDFRGAAFTADTVFRIERRRITGNGQYELHVWERPIVAIPDCADLVNAECFTGDFMGED